MTDSEIKASFGDILAKTFQALTRDMSVPEAADILSEIQTDMVKKVTASATMKAKQLYKRNVEFNQFCTDCLVREVSAEAHSGDLITRYRKWFKCQSKVLSLLRTVFLELLQEKYGDPIGNVFVGVRILEEGEEPTCS